MSRRKVVVEVPEVPLPPLRRAKGRFNRARMDRFIEMVERRSEDDPRYAVLLANIFHLTAVVGNRSTANNGSRGPRVMKVPAEFEEEGALTTEDLRRIGLAAAQFKPEEKEPQKEAS